MNKNVLLIGFHNEKALGVRYLANALENEGYKPHIVFFKRFNSQMPNAATREDLDALAAFIRQVEPCLIGISAMSSLYMETLEAVNGVAREYGKCPVAWGGVLATLQPEMCAGLCDYALRGEGEITIVALLRVLENGESPSQVPGIAYRDGDRLVLTEMPPLEQNLDVYGYPRIGGDNLYLIDDGKVTEGDPQLGSFVYELLASRGCPFACSYCSSINIHRLYKGKGKYVRFRSVESVMEELNAAKKAMPRLRVVHFWDEIFSDDQNWIDEFCSRYKREINVPFRIWSHPLKTDEETTRKLVDAGLHQVVMGIQSGSRRVRKDIFHRPETQEQIIEATRVISRCKVPKVYYDFMIRHAFESLEDLKETFYLCLELAPPFQLQIHGLNYLPATDIVDMALEEKLYTEAEMQHMMYSTLQEQYDNHWGPTAAIYKNASEGNVWVALIYLTQFPKIRDKVLKLAEMAERDEGTEEILALKKKMEGRQRYGDLWDKAKLVLKIGK